MTTTTSRSMTDTVHTITRRRLLWWSLGGVAGALMAGGASLSWLSRSAVDGLPAPEFQHLSAAEYHLFRRAASALLPTEGTALPPVDSLPFFHNVDHLFSLFDASLRQDVHRLLWLLDRAPLLSHGKRLVDLSDGQIRALLDRWSEGSFLQRALGGLIKQFVYVNYWREPATWEPLEFDGPVSDRWGMVSLGNAPLPDESLDKGVAR